MQRKAAAQKHSFKEQYEKLSERLKKNMDDIEKLLQATSVPAYSAIPDQNVLKNLLQECEDSQFWQNFKRAAPIIFCTAIENDTNLKQIRDMSFIEELLKTKSIVLLMKDKVEKAEADVDIVEYSLATKMLESKLQVLQALNIQVEEEGNEKITLNVKGSNKSIQIDLAKLRESITIVDGQVPEMEGSAHKANQIENINLENISEEEFLNQVVEKIGTVQKSKNKTLAKDTFIKIFKYTGDFAKLRSKDIK